MWFDKHLLENQPGIPDNRLRWVEPEEWEEWIEPTCRELEHSCAAHLDALALAICNDLPTDDDRYLDLLQRRNGVRYELSPAVIDALRPAAPHAFALTRPYDGPRLMNPKQMTRSHVAANLIGAAMRRRGLIYGDWIYNPIRDQIEAWHEAA